MTATPVGANSARQIRVARAGTAPTGRSLKGVCIGINVVVQSIRFVVQLDFGRRTRDAEDTSGGVTRRHLGGCDEASS
ncbi:hypothetical protein EA473_15120 [Natrarchaeobius chitinivorans]|uniref:Uncharacterized protein n=1 Tax=Natrarchaeobius chitinivorans TaxID=1679083 RepID=A0A3N6MAI3_NATCH|nr:hypothetical protein EA473_15120 [Natrarchaeobius chitinivorans]